MSLRSYLGGLFRPGGKALPVPAGTVTTGVGGAGLTQRMATYTSYLAAIKTVPHVYDAISLIGYNVARTRLRVLDEDDNDVDIRATEPLLHHLLTQPNREMDGFTFTEFMTYDLLLTGNSLTALDNWTALGVRDYGAVPTEMIRLRPDQVSKGRAPDGSILYGYEVNAPNWSRPIWYEAEEIIDRRITNPLNPLWGIGYIEAGELAFSAARAVDELTYNFLNQGAILKGVLTMDVGSKDQYDEVMTRWRAVYEGTRAQLKVAILSQGATYQPIQEPLGSVPIIELKKMSRNQVLQLFGVPPQLLGDFEGSNYRNAQEARAFFHSNTLAPLLVRLEPGWTRLVSLFGPYHAEYEQKEVLDYQTRAETALRLAQTGAMTVNQINVAAGFDPYEDDDPFGEMIVVPTTMSVQSIDHIQHADTQALEGDEAQALPAVVSEETDEPLALSAEDAEDADIAPAPLRLVRRPGAGRKALPLDLLRPEVARARTRRP